MNSRKNRTTRFKNQCSALLTAVLLLTLPLTAQNQLITVKGKVVDEKSEPVIGATIKVEGTSTGTVTDLNGSFQLRAAANSTVSISYIGYVTQKIKSGQVPAVITLQEEAERLDELVVVGYGAVKRANLTGAVANIDMKEVADIPAPNLASVLMGTMPGVKVGEATGNVIGNSTIQIRINGSWNSEEPLFVIDGFIRDLNALSLIHI